MVTCPQAVLLVHFTSANEIPDILLIPSSTVPNSPVRFLLCLTASRLGPQIPFGQVHARHTIYPFMKPLISPIHPPRPTHLCSIHPSIHPPTYLAVHSLYSIKFLASRKFIWYFSYYPMETGYSHCILIILLLLLN